VSPFTQLLSIGLVWISFHCVGMCGPIVIGFDLAGAARGLGPLRGGLRVLVYQAGRATTLATLGALAGLGGRVLTRVFEHGAAVFTLLFGLSLLALTIVRLIPRRPAPARPALRLGQPPAVGLGVRFSGWLRALSLAGTVQSTWLLGVLMGFLPCMIVLWALGLAATTTSPWQGALLMIVLVLMTTPMLLFATLLPRILPLAWRARLPKVLLGVSGAWLVLVGLAGLEALPHLHLALGPHQIMLW